MPRIAVQTEGGVAFTPPEPLPPPPDPQYLPRIQVYLWDQPSPIAMVSSTREVVLHEYTHGLSSRRVGGGVGDRCPANTGFDEGWSDFYALALLSEENDDVHAKYAFGAYAHICGAGRLLKTTTMVVDGTHIPPTWVRLILPIITH